MNRRDIRHYLKLSGKIILDGIYPRGCVVCGSPLEFDKRDHPERTHEECMEFLKPVDGPVCCKCGKKINADGSITEVTVDWNKLPCRKCDRRYHFCCPKSDCWNKKGEYCVY